MPGLRRHPLDPRGWSRRRVWGLGILGALALVALFGALRMASVRVDLLTAREELLRARQAAATLQFDSAGASLIGARERLEAARRTAGSFPLGPLRAVPLAGSPIRAAAALSSAGLDAVAAGRLVVDATSTLPSSGSGALDGGDVSGFHTAARSSTGSIGAAVERLDVAIETLRGPSSAVLPFVAAPAQAMSDELSAYERQLRAVHNGLGLAAELSGPDAEARLLVLSQNTLELRPTGGYIGSYGVLRFTSGTVQLERYEPIESLPPPVPPMEPPPELAPALPRYWSLSNVNWWPDFPTTATVAREMFRRQGGGTVDGVLALTESALARVVGAIGPLHVPGYTQPVAEQGFAERLTYEIELKRPFDNPRKRFLTEMSKVVFATALDLSAPRVPVLVSALGTAVGAGDIQLWFADGARQRRIQDMVIAGRLPRPEGDFLMVIDTNLTASKANLGVVKDITYEVGRSDDGKAVARLRIDVRNDGEASVLNPGYNALLRVYVPPGARLALGKERQGLALPDAGYEVFAQQVTVAPKSRQVAVFDYVLPESALPDGPYALTWVRQVGTSRDSLTALVEGRGITVPASQRSFHMGKLPPPSDHNKVIRWFRERWLVEKVLGSSAGFWPFRDSWLLLR